uniref:phosphomannomutase n=1 Tax=uncultured gamma proteobacterium HF0010_20H22 TaxID=723562 RepID=E7C1R2_9GAMM|nr:phosphomannomutase [uncultured gamma proteobacterium HF0010_20H22]
MKVNSEIFRAYDIRGIAGKELTEEGIFYIGKAIGTLILSEGRKSLLTARDGRISGPSLLRSFQEGVLASGCNVADLGLLPTPLLYFATFKTKIPDGVMLTGSHNPKNYNGLKIVIDKKSMTSQKIEEIKNMISNDNYFNGSGEMSKLEIKKDYLKELQEKIRLDSKLKVCLDCGNGVGGLVAPDAFKILGINLIEMFSNVDGEFPNHHPDPSNLENLKDLQSKVLETNSDLGIALDGDGDRVGLVDNKGEVIFPDIYMMLLAEDILERHRSGNIVYDIKCSNNLKNVILNSNGIPIISRTGHSYIKSKIIEENALLGGEMSGHIFFNDDWYGFDDGIYSALRLIEILSKRKSSAHKIFGSYPKNYSTPEISIPISDKRKFKIIDKLKPVVNKNEYKLVDIDGIRLEKENCWGLIRASNTSPSLVLRFEGRSEQDLNEIKNYFKEILSKIDIQKNIFFDEYF